MCTVSIFSGSRWASLVSRSVLAAGTLLAACYNPNYGSNSDASMAFRCFATDNPICPPGLVCCAGTVCGDQLMPTQEGWCVAPQPPQDMTVTAVSYWQFGTKPMFYPGVTMDPGLTGVDPDTGLWRCHRDDTNPNKADPTKVDKAIVSALEPNDLPADAITLTTDLIADPPATYTGNPYEICPDRSAPGVPDVDVFKFKLTRAVKVLAEIKYKVAFGDLDVALFQMGKDPDTGVDMPQLIHSDQTGVDNACIEANNLMPGTYYVVVRGTKSQDTGTYSMNRYSLKVYTTVLGATCAKRD